MIGRLRDKRKWSFSGKYYFYKEEDIKNSVQNLKDYLAKDKTNIHQTINKVFGKILNGN